MNWTFEPERPRPSTLATFAALSLLLHVLLLAWLRGARFSVTTPPERPIVVKLAPPPAAATTPAKPLPPPAAVPAPPKAPPPDAAAQATKPPPPAVPLRNQVVAPSDRENDQAPDKPARLSDRDNRVEKETVRRGNPDAGEKAPPPAPQAKARAAAKPPAPGEVGPPRPPAARIAKSEGPKAPPRPVPATAPARPAAPKAAPAPKAPPRPRPAPPPPRRADEATPPEPVARADAKPMLEPPADRLDAPPRIEPRPRPAPRTRPKPEPREEAAAEREERTRADTRPRGARGGKRALPGLDALLPPAAEVLAGGGRPTAGDRPAPGERADRRDDPRRDLVSAPPPKPGFFGGNRGTFDSLPGVAQGSLTMLNTKADRFAPFVRRVGTRVFQNLLIFQRQNLGINDILAAHEPVTVRCLLDRSGQLKDIRVEDRSGSLAVDQTLVEALREAAFDSNPPPSAANANGEFEFVFVAQIAAQVGGSAEAPQVRMIESRLRVGLL